MSRFYDQILNKKLYRPEDEQNLRHAVVMVADQATEYYYAINDKEFWHLTDFPNVAPPFDNFFIETHRPSKIVSKKWGVREWFQPATKEMMLAEGMQEETVDNYLEKCRLMGNRDPRRPLNWGIHFRVIPKEQINLFARRHVFSDIQLLDVRWMMKGVLYVDWADPSLNVSVPVWEMCYGIKEDGSIAPNLADTTENSAIGIDGPTVEYRDLLPLKWQDNHQLFQSLRNEMINHIQPLMLAITFVHCKNVTLKNEAPAPKFAKKSRERGRPLCSYKVIDIIPLKSLLRREGKSEVTGIKQALHVCRGHFKTYTADKPLLGKAVGSFFWHQQVRGSKEHGVIAKDYRIENPGPSAKTPETPD